MPEKLGRLTGWGRTAPTTARILERADRAELADVVRAADGRGVIPRGLGRSYGDASQNAGGLVLDMTAFDQIHHVDTETGIVTVDAGVSLDKLMRQMLPHGLWIPVLPGTRQVTIGGAIAADIHGKNHHVEGSFCNHVLAIELLTADGEIRTVTPDGPGSELFWATAGGMGLTGVVLRATVQLKSVESAYFLVDTERTRDLDDLMSRLMDNDDQYTYSVAWFDAASTGAKMGRAVLTRGWSAKLDDLPAKLRNDPLKFNAPQLATVPPVFPSGLLNKLTVSAFNEVWYRKAPKERRGEVQNITQFFHPLDIVGEWNRVYGPRGFLQYQYAVPYGAEDTVRKSMEIISSGGAVSFLNVLKRFGAANGGPLSFPMPGWTLAVDIPITDDLGPLLDKLDQLVLEAGGRLYLAKDSRLTADAFRSMYPRLAEWQKVRDAVDPRGVFNSDLSRRLML
ncbi:FAD-binding oxidoreductase [Allokutzneria sp. A3M-2-11 16]|uniref:FAD-binding oxidoreductase n=1 Tax=Allokutzneria sp. A3M-2-11 16 TaxID=2962043 RepID=UPI0020B7D3D1|nr:FAD-binding oxidoreductase [Allokutzneria sp. A3M-2-11 16]MCP3799690.1 FAD-binding oxidoreductase [Allokutzneria sp. A3M-2-11 16]